MTRKKSVPDEAAPLLAAIHEIEFFVEGSLTVTHKRCGNPRCRCATEGPIHETALLTWKEGRKTRTLYVPVDSREEVAQWVAEAKRLKRLMHDVSAAQRRRLQSRRRNTPR
jgi:hypothetical protein